jgi:hypothetical protein
MRKSSRRRGLLDGAGDYIRDVGDDVRKVGLVVKYVLAKQALIAELMKLEDKVGKLPLDVAAKNALLGRIKQAIRTINTCELEPLVEVVGDLDPAQGDAIPEGKFRDRFDACRHFARLIFWKRFHDLNADERPVSFRFDPKTGKLTVKQGVVEHEYQCPAGKRKEAAAFVKRLQEKLEVCLYSDIDDGKTWGELFQPA